MIERNRCRRIGYLKKTYGPGDRFILSSENDLPLNFEKTKMVFLLLDGELVPFYIAPGDVLIRNATSAVIKFDDLFSLTRIKKLSGTDVYVASVKNETPGHPDTHASVIGFTVVDRNLGNLGIVSDYIESCVNPLIEITQGKKKILIPFIHPIIIMIKTNEKIIEIEAPEGLTEING